MKLIYENLFVLTNYPLKERFNICCPHCSAIQHLKSVIQNILFIINDVIRICIISNANDNNNDTMNIIIIIMIVIIIISPIVIIILYIYISIFMII